MIPNCRGCKEEYAAACDMVTLGFHIATTTFNNFIDKRHFTILIVDDNGELMKINGMVNKKKQGGKHE